MPRESFGFPLTRLWRRPLRPRLGFRSVLLTPHASEVYTLE